MSTLTEAPIVAPSSRWEPLSSRSAASSPLSLSSTPVLSNSTSSPSLPSINSSTYSTGRSRSNTLTAVLNSTSGTNFKPDDLSSALGSLSLGSGGVRPRKGSVVRRDRSSSFTSGFNSTPTVSSSLSSSSSSSSSAAVAAAASPSAIITNGEQKSSILNNHIIIESNNKKNNTRAIPIAKEYLQYPPPPRPLSRTLMSSTLDNGLENSTENKEELYYADSDHEPLLSSSLQQESPLNHTTTTNTATMVVPPKARSSSTLSSGWNFFIRVLILIGLFLASLGGLYLMAKLLPPLSLPKSIDDVKEDAEILQQFATADYDGWLRTFWVFSAVYIWKQSFGIPGSAFLNILAGALYGPWFGTLLTSLLTTAGSVVAYFVSWFLMEPILERYASTRLNQMRQMIQKKANAGKNRPKKRRLSSSTNDDNDATTTNVDGALLPSWSHHSTALGEDTTTTSGQHSTTATDIGGPTNTALAKPMLRTRSSSITNRQTIVHIHPGSTAVITPTSTGGPETTLSSSAAASSPVAVVARQDVSLEFEIQPAADGGFDLPYEKTHNHHHQHVDLRDEKDGGYNDIRGEDKDEDEDETDGEGTSLFMQLLWIRLFPLTPYWFINLASPLIGVPLWPFMTSMFIGVTPYNYLCAQAGAILGEIHELRDIYQQPRILLQIVLVVVLMTVAVWATRHFSKKEKQQQEYQELQLSPTGSQAPRTRKNKKSRSSDDSTVLRSGNDDGDEARQQLLTPLNNNAGSDDEDEANLTHDKDELLNHVELSTLRAKHQYRASAKRDTTVIDMHY
ncbi:Transmembrane protein 41A [Actinomortierella wolfii]|nr:Transmembrane protein 41A [Actinomortierella wolfii]